MANYDHDVIGVGNSNHPANQTELSDSDVFSYLVDIDEMSDSIEFDDYSDAQKKFDEMIKADDIEFETLAVVKWNKINLEAEKVIAMFYKGYFIEKNPYNYGRADQSIYVFNNLNDCDESTGSAGSFEQCKTAIDEIIDDRKP
mgnify:CR=1 FL=1